jgi:ribonuclease HI
VGLAVVLQQSLDTFSEIAKKKLPRYSSVFQGELAAISEALQHAQDIQLKDKSIYIFSDSRSSLELLKQPEVAIPVCKKVQKQICDLRTYNNCITHLSWVRGHSSIPGNEAADILAKAACDDGDPIANPLTFLSNTFYKTKIQSKTNNIWQEMWSTSCKGRLTFKIFPDISSTTEYLECIRRLNNRACSLIFQAMSGHIPVNDYLCRFHLQPNKSCDSCHAEKEDITHLLIECPRFSLQRFKTLTPLNMQARHMRFSDYFRSWSLPLTLEILNTRFQSIR